MVPNLRRKATLTLSLLGALVLAGAFFLLVSSHMPGRSVELGIAAHSPLGASGGLVVPASCPSYDHGTGGACSPVCQSGYDFDINGNCVPINNGTSHPLLDQPVMGSPSCNASGNVATLSWGSVPNAGVYPVRFSAAGLSSCPSGWWSAQSGECDLDTSSATSISISITPGVEYLWWVHAKYADSWEGASGFTKQPLMCLASPASMSATCNADHSTATLSWAASTGATSYNPRFSYPTTVSSCPSGWTLYTDGKTCYINNYSGTSINIPVASGTTYNAWVHAVNGGSVSVAKGVPGNAFTCTVPALPEPTKINPLTLNSPVCNAAGTQVTLSWNPVSASGAAYAPRYAGSGLTSCPSGWVHQNPSDPNECDVDDISATSVTVPVTPGTTYQWWVHAKYPGTWNGLSSQTHATFSCAAPSNPAPTCTISANPSSTTSGGSVTLTKSSTNATSATLNGVSTATSGTTTVNPTTTTTYTMNVSGAGGSGSCSTTVTVSANPPPTCTITASPTSTTSGGSVTLTKTSTNATSATLNGVSTATSGTTTVNPTITTTYTMNVSGAGGSGSCSAQVTVGASPGTFFIKRVGSDLSTATAPSGTYAATDAAPSSWDPSNPATFSSISTGSHAIYVTDVSGYTEMAGTCQYVTGGSECSVSTFNLTPTCNGSSCTVSGLTVSSGYTTKVAVQYTATVVQGPGAVKIKRVGSDLTTSTVPSGAYAALDNASWSQTNPYDYSGATAGSHTADFTDVSGYTEMAATCTYTTGGTECSVSTFDTTPTCDGTRCYVPITVSTGITTKVAVQYTAAATCTITASPTSTTSGGAVTLTKSSTNATSATLNGVSTATSGTQTVNPTTTTTYTMNVSGAGGSGSCSTTVTVGSAGPGSVRIKRVGSDLTVNTAPSGQSGLDNASWSQTNPYDYSGATAGSHTADFTDVSGYTEMAATCTYTTGGTECTTSTFNLTPTCDGTRCYVPITVSTGITTKVAVQYTAAASASPTCAITPTATAVPYGGGYASLTTSASNASYGYFNGAYMGTNLSTTQSPYVTSSGNQTMTVWNSTGTVSGSCAAYVTVCASGQTVSNNACVTSTTMDVQTVRVGSAQTTASVPAGTTSSLDGSAGDSTNPNVYSGVAASTHTATFTDLSGYSETFGSCFYTPGSSCSVSTFGTLAPTCNGSTCSVTTPYQTGSYTRVAVMYTNNPTCTITPSSTAVAYPGGYSSLTTTGTNASYAYFDSTYIGSAYNGTQSPYDSTTRTHTMTVYNSAGTLSGSCSATVTVCASGQTVSGGTCVASTPAPTCTITASPTSVSSGGSVTLTKTSTNATSATLNGVSTATSGTTGANPTTTTTYTMNVSGAGGSGSCSTTVTVAGASTGAYLVKRVGSDLTTATAPSGTYAATDQAPSTWDPSNPATFSSVSTASQSVYVTDVSGYTEMAGTCQYVTGGSECSVSTFNLTPTCNGSSCTVSGLTVSSGYTTKVAVQYTVTTTGSGAISCSASSVASGGSISGTVTGGSSTSDWVSVFSAGAPTSGSTYGTGGSSPTYIFVPLPRPQTVTFTAPTTSGNYELRLQSNGGFTTIASCPFTVSASGSCPSGYGGTYPNCTCPTGYTGTYPNCTQSCPAGYGGTYPNCTCPSGYTGTYPTCTPPPTTGEVMIKRVDTNSNLLTTTSSAYVDNASGSVTTNPATFSSITAGSHTAYFSDLSGNNETIGTCTYATGGTECSVTTFPTTPTCSAGFCSTSVTVTAGQTTKVAVKYTSTGGDIMVKRVDESLSLISGTAAAVDSSGSNSNPATFSGLSTTGTHTVLFSDLSGYAETTGSCTFPTGGTECSVSTFPTAASCSAGACSIPAFAVSSGQTTKVVVQYSAIGNPVIDLHVQDPGSIRVHSGDSVTIVWNVTNGAGWTGVLTGPGVSGGGLSGSVTKIITAQSTFTLTLTPPSGSGLSPVTKTLTVSLIPAGSEI